MTKLVSRRFDISCVEFSTTFYRVTFNQRTKVMQSYTVESGTVRIDIVAKSATKAAVWAIHRAMGQIIPVHPAATTVSDEKGPIEVLGSEISIWPSSTTRAAGVTMPTIEVIGDWNRMVCALDRLERMLDSAA